MGALRHVKIVVGYIVKEYRIHYYIFLGIPDKDKDNENDSVIETGNMCYNDNMTL